MAKKRPSHWRRLIDACPLRTKHLEAALIADDPLLRHECLDVEAGLGIVLLCLSHHFDLLPEEVESLREVALESWGWPGNSDLRPQYKGGDPRIRDEYGDVEWPATEDMEELAEDLADNLLKTTGVLWMVCGADYLETWSWTLSEGCVGDVGYLTGELIDDNENRKEFVAATWSPPSDGNARRRAVLAAFDWWMRESELGASAFVVRARDPELLVDCVINGFDPGFLIQVAVEKASLAASLPDDFWRSRGATPPADSWWSAPSIGDAERRLSHDPAFGRQLAAFYSGVLLEDVLGREYDEESERFSSLRYRD